MSKTNKLRFHLGRGNNFMKWQYRKADGKTVTYFPTENFYGVIRGKLHNNRKVAEKINEGENKTVCSWIASENGLTGINEPVLMHAEADLQSANYISIYYNPRELPFWHTANGIDLDGYNGLIFIFEKRLYIETDALLYWLDQQ